MALINKLVDIADAIREKTGSTEKLTLEQMATEISNLAIGGGGGGDLPEEAFVITGKCSYRFANNGWNWFIDNYGNQITTKDINESLRLFADSDELEAIPFDLNFYLYAAYNSLGYMFNNCKKLKAVPKMNNAKPSDLGYMFAGCYLLREIPEDLCDSWDWSYLNGSIYANCASLFQDCYSLRSVPMILTGNRKAVANASASYTPYYNAFKNCYVLDELVDYPVINRGYTSTSNMFNGTFTNCHRLKNMIFATQEDGTPVATTWKGQTIDLSSTGYGAGKSWGNISLNKYLNYNSGITEDKYVKDDATYQALKDDADWFAAEAPYSRYNRTSAVATINSLPDTTSGGGTNTIKFTGAAGSATDGGAIETLTEEEIAVATAKGWTVSLA